jgi:hypothetical protein
MFNVVNRLREDNENNVDVVFVCYTVQWYRDTKTFIKYCNSFRLKNRLRAGTEAEKSEVTGADP